MERWTEYCSKLYKNKDDNDTVKELMKEVEWILPPQKDDTGDYILKEEVEKAITRMKNNKNRGRLHFREFHMFHIFQQCVHI